MEEQPENVCWSKEAGQGMQAPLRNMHIASAEIKEDKAMYPFVINAG